MNKEYDEKSKPYHYEVGDRVWVRCPKKMEAQKSLSQQKKRAESNFRIRREGTDKESSTSLRVNKFSKDESVDNTHKKTLLKSVNMYVKCKQDNPETTSHTCTTSLHSTGQQKRKLSPYTLSGVTQQCMQPHTYKH